MIKRILVTGLSLSAAGLIGFAANEGYVETAMIPTQNDVPTAGFGSTVHIDGKRVKLGDRLDPVLALKTLNAHAEKDAQALRESLPNGALSQGEFDLYMGWIYQYGRSAWARSPMVEKLNAGDYRGACQALLIYKYVTATRATPGWEAYKWDASGRPTRWRFDCSTPGNKICRGVWTRQLDRHHRCIAIQEALDE